MFKFLTKPAAIILAVAMLIALAPTAAFAAGNIALDKSAYSIGEPMTVIVTGLTEEQMNSKAYVSIYKVGARPDQYGKWVRINSLIAGEWSVDAPVETGNYEMRVYSADPATDADLVDMAPFTVKYFTENNITVSLDKSVYDTDDEIAVTVSGATDVQTKSKAYVSIYKVGARADQYMDWSRLSDLIAGEWKVKAPRDEGNYEMRVYVVDPPVDDALIAMAPFSLGTGVEPQATAAAPAVQPSASAQPTATLKPATPVQTTAPVGAPEAPPVSAVSGAAVGAPQVLTVGTGVKLEWTAVDGALGSRVYRSKTAGAEGLSITDFMITSTSYVDVNVDANTTYYYTIRAVMKEADAATGEREQLGAPSAEFSAKTGSSIIGGDAAELGANITKNVILMKLDDPYMSINGVRQEVDEGRGTAPLEISGRTMVPIRAVIEAMGGKADFDDAEQKILLNAAGHAVEMWVDMKDLVVDGQSKEMDIAPYMSNDRTFVPVRFAAENVGCVVDWISSTSEIVIVFYTGGTPPASVLQAAATSVAPDAPPQPAVSAAPVQSTVPSAPPTLSGGTLTEPDTDSSSAQQSASLPPQASSGSAGNGPEIKTTYTAAELAKLRADIEALIQDAPTGGRVITYAELEKMLDPYRKSLGSGNTDYSKQMMGQFEKRTGRWSVSNLCQIVERWIKDSTYMDMKSETLHIVNTSSPEKEGAVECMLNKEDANFTYMYMWFKTATTGDMYKMPKTSYPSADYEPGLMPDLKVTVYPDAVVDGQECIVYSYDIENTLTYFWFSKQKGFDILMEMFSQNNQEVTAIFTYDMHKMNCNDDFFDPDKQGVTVWNDLMAGYAAEY